MSGHTEALIGFDLDKTLIRSASWYRLNLAMGMTAEEDEALYRRGPEKDGELTYEQWMHELENIYQARGKANRQSVQGVLLDYSILDGAAQAIQTLKNQGHLLAIVTGGFELVAADVAGKLGIEIVRANVRLDFDKDGSFRRINLAAADDRAFKAATMKELQRQYNVADTHLFYVADGDNDENVFAVTRGVQITPNAASHEPWKAAALASGEKFALHHAKKAAEFELASIIELPELLSRIETK